MQQEEIEIQLWGYIDGTCTEQDRKRIALLIASNSLWCTLHQELLVLNNNLSTNTTLETLPDDFSNNVMSTIQSGAKKKRTTTWIDWSIKGIAAFFVLSISSILIYTLSQTDWQFDRGNPSALNFDKIQLPKYNTDIQLTNGTLYATAFIVLIMILVIIDKLVHRNSVKAI